MNETALDRIRIFGKVGKIVMRGLLALAVLVSLLAGKTLIAAASIRTDAVTLTVTDRAELRIDEKSIAAAMRVAGGLNSDGAQLVLWLYSQSDAELEGKEIETELQLFGHSYSTAQIHAEGATRVVEASAAPVTYCAGGLVLPLLFLLLKTATLAVLAWAAARCFGALEECDSPFCPALVRRLRTFGWWLLPLAVFSSAEETLYGAFLTQPARLSIRIQWGCLLAFAVTVFLTAVFRYGVQLQREADETL